MIKKFFFLGLLLSAFAVPYLLSQGEGTPLLSMWNKAKTTGNEQDSEAGPSIQWPASLSAEASNDEPPIYDNVEVAPFVPVEQAISFNVTIPWVLGTWPHVSTGIVDNGLFGYRVPLVTGPAEDDITGSLTYFFGPDKILRRIALAGDSGDARRLVALLASRYQVSRHLTDEQGVFYYRSARDSQIQTELRVRPRGIVRAATPHERFVISLQMSRVPAER